MALREVNGVTLLVEEAGSGPPLVLVHGSWNSRSTWALVEQVLAPQFRTVSYDRRGHTASTDGPEPGSRRDDEDDLAGLLDTLGLAPAHVVGNSFGASIALGLAARQPELFATLSVHEPPLLSLVADDPMVAQLGAAMGPVLDLIERGEAESAAHAFVGIVRGPGAWEQMPEKERDIVAANAGTFLGEQRDAAWAAIDLEALGRISVPVLLTRGGESPPFFAAIVDRLSAVLPHSEVSLLPEAGHVPHATHPAEYAAVIGNFAGRGT